MVLNAASLIVQLKHVIKVSVVYFHYFAGVTSVHDRHEVRLSAAALVSYSQSVDEWRDRDFVRLIQSIR